MKEIKITIPDNCELKQDGNTYTIVEKRKEVTYEDVAKELFEENEGFYIDEIGNIEDMNGAGCRYSDLVNCTSRRQAEKLLAINKLMNVAKYLNGDWQPNWNNANECKWFIYFSNVRGVLDIDYICSKLQQFIYFKSKDLTLQAIEILGKETIKLALCTDY